MRISLKTMVGATVWAALIGWIALEAMSALVGPASYRALAEREATLAQLEADLVDLSAHRERLTQRADRLNSAHIDAELLDERVRAVLGYVSDGEWVASRAEIEAALSGDGEWPDMTAE
ncbi:MAG: hypothetical protein GC152_05290 [Alphaproteobacteria bacterium]|nr:hypothetical protein [Alphaproteobacteria bacterium]